MHKQHSQTSDFWADKALILELNFLSHLFLYQDPPTRASPSTRPFSKQLSLLSISVNPSKCPKPGKAGLGHADVTFCIQDEAGRHAVRVAHGHRVGAHILLPRILEDQLRARRGGGACHRPASGGASRPGTGLTLTYWSPAVSTRNLPSSAMSS